MQKLFSSCPVLEDLVIKRHGWDGVGIMNISVPSLNRLSISSSSLRSIGNYEYKVVINTPNLEYFEIDDYMYEDYSVNSSPSLVEACVQGTCVFGLLDGISQVKLLTLSGDAMQVCLHTFLSDFNFYIYLHTHQVHFVSNDLCSVSAQHFSYPPHLS